MTFKTPWDDFGPFDVHSEDDPFAKPRCVHCRRQGGQLVGWGQFHVHPECRFKAVEEPPAQPADIAGQEVRFADAPCDGCGSSKATIDDRMHLLCIRCSATRGLLKQSTADWLRTVARKWGAPESITVRQRDVCVSTPDAADAAERK